MREIKAHINDDGINSVICFANNPSELDFEPVAKSGAFYKPMDQVYIAGITVPGYEGLDIPFMVPILGDNESYCLSIDWPQKDETEHFKRIRFAGMLPAEAVVYEFPKDPFFDDGDQALDEAFDEMTGDWGAFLLVCVTNLYDTETDTFSTAGEASFFQFEDESETRNIHKLLGSGALSALDIINAYRYPLSRLV